MKIDKKIYVGIFAAAVLAAAAFVWMNGGNNGLGKKGPDTINAAGGLNEAQIVACDAAQEGNTCKTKLTNLVGLVTLDDCCKKLGKCCD